MGVPLLLKTTYLTNNIEFWFDVVIIIIFSAFNNYATRTMYIIFSITGAILIFVLLQLVVQKGSYF